VDVHTSVGEKFEEWGGKYLTERYHHPGHRRGTVVGKGIQKGGELPFYATGLHHRNMVCKGSGLYRRRGEFTATPLWTVRLGDDARNPHAGGVDEGKERGDGEGGGAEKHQGTLVILHIASSPIA
jgi:hypothetical protein